jgi:CoA:oxalate CoA-transferase
MISINGFGSVSSWRDRRAFAPVLHAATGILDDQAERTGQPVAQLAQAYGDMVTALHATVAILAALRARDRSGEGEHVELAMFDAVMATYTETNFALLDPPEGRDTGPIFDAGPHGLVTLAGTPQHCWHHLSRRHPELRDGAPAGADVATKARLRRAAIEAWMAEQPSRDELIHSVEAAGIACAAVERLRDAATGPLARERGILVEVDDRQGGTRPVVRSPWRFSRSGASIRGPAPRRGEHNEAVLGEILGLSDAELRRLVEQGVLSTERAEPGARRGAAGED